MKKEISTKLVELREEQPDQIDQLRQQHLQELKSLRANCLKDLTELRDFVSGTEKRAETARKNMEERLSDIIKGVIARPMYVSLNLDIIDKQTENVPLLESEIEELKEAIACDRRVIKDLMKSMYPEEPLVRKAGQRSVERRWVRCSTAPSGA